MSLPGNSMIYTGKASVVDKLGNNFYKKLNRFCRQVCRKGVCCDMLGDTIFLHYERASNRATKKKCSSRVFISTLITSVLSKLNFG